jgi:hypothetical protein
MPIPGQQSRGVEMTEAEMRIACEELWREFRSTAKWQKSKSNPRNIWRMYEGRTLTVFRKYGRFRWSIADAEQVIYSEDDFDTRSDAIDDVGTYVGVCY